MRQIMKFFNTKILLEGYDIYVEVLQIKACSTESNYHIYRNTNMVIMNIFIQFR